MYYLVIQNDFAECSVALFFEKTKKGEVVKANHEASKNLIAAIEFLLEQEQKKLADMHCIMVNTGPAPYTALRTTIALINGIAFGTAIPLIPVDGLRAFLAEYYEDNKPTLAILNAFGNDVYYGLQIGEVIQTGWLSFDACIALINEFVLTQPLRLIGNGIDLYKEKLALLLKHKYYFVDPLPLTCSVDGVMHYGYAQLHTINDQKMQTLSIGYLKTYQPFKK